MCWTRRSLASTSNSMMEGQGEALDLRLDSQTAICVRASDHQGSPLHCCPHCLALWSPTKQLGSLTGLEPFKGAFPT
jgi:hypothetical protein